MSRINHPGMARCSLALVASLLVAAACSRDDGGSPPPTPVPPATADALGTRGAYAVGVRSYTLVDTSRPTAPNGDYAGAPERTLPVEVWYPAIGDAAMPSPEVRDAPLDARAAPYPLIIFAHGYSSVNRQSTSYVQHLASHGYIVAAPTFPSSRIGAPGGPRLSAVLEQPADVSFVIDTLLAYSGDATHPLAGAVDASRIGVTGHSLGGLTTLLTAYGPRRDARVRAIAPISPPACFVPRDAGADAALPAMVIGGSIELIVNPRSIRAAYDAASKPKYWVEIIGGDHIRFADTDLEDSQLGNIVPRLAGGPRNLATEALAIARETGADIEQCVLDEARPPDAKISGARQRELLRVYATAFFDAYLRDDAGALAFLRGTAASVAGVRYEVAE